MLPPGAPPGALRVLEASPEILAQRGFSRFSQRAVLHTDLTDKGFTVKNRYGMLYERVRVEAAPASSGSGFVSCR